jgi:uncharacterized protein YciI
VYVVLLTYVASLEDVDRALPDHAAWLAEQYDAGHFLASGRRNPRIGGVIIARTMPRDRLDAVLAADPFGRRHLATHEVIEFEPSRTAPELAGG